ncbi:MAG: trans-aconitate 2-methyltransferase, partial [Acidimicrobiia bacterium]|nr:trans-aconitate 2-methyltransferase [Acidimicrobiia bacterium]
LFPALAESLAPGGVLAAQMPRNFDEPTHRVLYEVARRKRWSPRVGQRAGWCPVDEPVAYFDRLAPVCRTVEIWETAYFHLLHGEDAAAQWVKGTAARPYLEDLGDDAEEFFAEYAAELRTHYPPRPGGATVLPFRRLFAIATR